MLRPPTKSLRHSVWLGCIISCVLCGVYILGCWYSVREKGSDVLLRNIGYPFLGTLAFLNLGISLSIILDAIRIKLKYKAANANLYYKCITFVICSIIGFIGVMVGSYIRMCGFQSIASKGAPLIEAIVAYQSTNGVPPMTLTKIGSGLNGGIATGVLAYPYYDYVRNEAPERYNGNVWVLYVPVSANPLVQESLVFFPEQIYPTNHLAVFKTTAGLWALMKFPQNN